MRLPKPVQKVWLSHPLTYEVDFPDRLVAFRHAGKSFVLVQTYDEPSACGQRRVSGELSPTSNVEFALIMLLSDPPKSQLTGEPVAGK